MLGLPWSRDDSEQPDGATQNCEDIKRVKEKRFIGDLNNSFFYSEGVAIWNTLPECMVEVSTLSIFKMYQDEHLNGHGIEGFRPKTGPRLQT